MNKVFYPTLDLFVYQLGEGLGADKQNVQGNQGAFLNNFPSPEIKKKVEQALNRSDLPKSARFTFLLTDPNHCEIPNQFINDYSVEQFYQPVISSDTYGLLFDSSIIPPEQCQPIESFQTLKSLVSHTQGNLGKTWLLSGYYPEGSEPKNLAKEIFKIIRCDLTTPQGLSWEWDQHSTGDFLGGKFYWIRSLYPTKDSLTERAFLIILYPETQLDKKIPHPETQLDEEFQQVAGNFNQYWLELFGYQNKIFWAQEQALSLKRELETGFLKIRNILAEIKLLANHKNKNEDGQIQQVEDIEVENVIAIKEIKAIIKNSAGTIADYAINLSYLKIQLTTIETQLQNHRLLIDHIETQGQPFGKTNLDGIREFNKVVENRHIKQVEQDYASLRPGLEALENLLHPIQSLVDLEEGERDRRLENWIAVIGIGMGTASIAASAIANFVEKIRQPQTIETIPPSKSPTPSTPQTLPLSPWSNFWFAFLISIAIGSAFSLLTLISLPIVRSWSSLGKKLQPSKKSNIQK
ncbi:hypothetical protein [Microcoleus sp. B13-B6]|uniref:hypothetical protein n=1 Tax=Microcoleus sp. B13-B6 TaxID=2818652 RepID=UPI002FD10732